MKIVFEGLELNEGIIKISLDGGFTFTDYEIADVKETFDRHQSNFLFHRMLHIRKPNDFGYVLK